MNRPICIRHRCIVHSMQPWTRPSPVAQPPRQSAQVKWFSYLMVGYPLLVLWISENWNFDHPWIRYLLAKTRSASVSFFTLGRKLKTIFHLSLKTREINILIFVSWHKKERVYGFMHPLHQGAQLTKQKNSL